MVKTLDIMEELKNKGYKISQDRGLSVDSIRKNSRETILSVSSSPAYNMCWLAKGIENVRREQGNAN